MSNAVPFVFLFYFSFIVNLLFDLKEKSTTDFINSKQTRKKPSIALSNVSRIFGWKTKFLIQQILINQHRYQDFRFRFIRFCCLSYSKQASLSLTLLFFSLSQNCLTKLEDKSFVWKICRRNFLMHFFLEFEIL